MKEIKAVRKDERGVIQEYQLCDGTVLGVDEAVQMVKNNEISNCNVGRTKDGKDVIRSNPDGDPSNNLDNLPTF